MKLSIRDGLWLIVAVCMALAWRNSSLHLTDVASQLQRTMDAAEAALQAHDAHIKKANREADVLSAEVRRLRGVVKSSLADQREWFELEVSGNQLVAIHRGTSDSNELTLDTVEKIERETGLEAQRLRHFLTPIPELSLGTE